jgi:hypothetical protein
MYLPNSDAYALADPSDASGIHTAEKVQPSLFDAGLPLLHAWPLSDAPLHDQALIDAAHALYRWQAVAPAIKLRATDPPTPSPR